ncbi:MAG: flagellar basal body-associated FliL family protein [Nitrospinae bacterium]|nr:flagellar basal body-associated FliL family protein [Nitrospinota bacterium]
MAEEAAAPEKGKSKLLIIIIAVVVLLLAVGGGAAFFLLSKKEAPAGEGGGATAGEHGEKGGEKGGVGESVELPPFIVNLSGEGGRYLKIVMVMQVSSAKAKEEIANRMPQIKDAIITVLSSKAPEDILSVEGKYELKMELTKRVNSLISTGVAQEIFFVEFVVQ